jgi:hypothetical protein
MWHFLRYHCVAHQFLGTILFWGETELSRLSPGLRLSSSQKIWLNQHIRIQVNLYYMTFHICLSQLYHQCREQMMDHKLNHTLQNVWRIRLTNMQYLGTHITRHWCIFLFSGSVDTSESVCLQLSHRFYCRSCCLLSLRHIVALPSLTYDLDSFASVYLCVLPMIDGGTHESMDCCRQSLSAPRSTIL